MQVLYLFDTLRLNSPEKWILNGFDYGPIRQLEGAHQAAVIWPRNRTCYDTDFGRILDPWPAQESYDAVYTWSGWLTTIGISLPVVGILLEIGTQPGSSNDFINWHYPNRNSPYPDEPYWAWSPEVAPRLRMVVDCPVDLMLTDSMGFRTGNIPNAPPDEPQFIAEIPDLRWYPAILPDGTRGWYLELPWDWIDMELVGTATGNMSLYMVDQTGQTKTYSQAAITEGQVANMTLDPAVSTVPAISFADGRQVLPDDLIRLGIWQYDDVTLRSSTVLSVTNDTAVSIHSPLWLVIENVWPAPVALVNADGILPDGKPYLDLSSLLDNGVLAPGQSADHPIVFDNPNHIRFDVDGELRGQTESAAPVTARLAARFVGLTSCAGQSYPIQDQAESNAANWEAWADAEIPENTYLADDSSRKWAGAASIWFTTDGGSDTCVRYPRTRDAAWDLSHAGPFHVSLYAENLNDFQDGPRIRLLTDPYNYFEYQFYQDGWPAVLLNDCRGWWRSYQIPLSGSEDENNGWRRNVAGSPDLANINYLEVHADTWDFGFQLWVDDVRFGPPVDAASDLNADCAVDLQDLLILSERWLAGNCTPAACAGADVNGDTAVDLRDFARLAQQWLENRQEY
jgi:hypothetical protein